MTILATIILSDIFIFYLYIYKSHTYCTHSQRLLTYYMHKIAIVFGEDVKVQRGLVGK